VKLEDLPIEWKRGGGLRKSDVISDGKNLCVLYGELFTRHKNVLIDIDKLSKTNNTGAVLSKKGDILIPGTSTASKRDMILAREIDISDVCIGGDINIIRPKEYIFAPKYLPYFFSTPDAYAQLEKYITGATGIIHISNVGIKNLNIPLPSIEMQKRIVVKLDEAFEKIDRAIELVEKNIKLSEQLFSNELSSVFFNGDDNWKKGRLDSFCVLQRGHDLPKSDRTPGIYKLASSSGIIDTHNIFKAEGPGVFTGRSGSIGGVFYEEENYWPLNTVLYVKEFYDNNPKLIYYLIKSLDFKKYSGGMGVPTLNRNNVHSLIVSLPLPNEQSSLVAELDNLSHSSNSLIKLYNRKLLQLKSLKSSVLREAFSESDVE
jgi:type I restriction enzyme S subunit